MKQASRCGPKEKQTYQDGVEVYFALSEWAHMSIITIRFSKYFYRQQITLLLLYRVIVSIGYGVGN